MKEHNPEEISRLKIAAQNYQTRSGPEEAVIKTDRWWIERYVKGPAILEMGCADGVATETLLSRAKALDVVEGSLEYCELVRARIKDPRLTVTNCLYEEFKPLRRYDDIVIARSLEMVENPVATLLKIREWLAPGGRLHVVVQNVASLHRRIGHALGMLPQLDSINESNVLVGNRRMYTREMLEDHTRSAGFQIELFKGYFLKPFDYATMSHASVDLITELIPALFEVGRTVPDDLCSSLYARCVPIT